jgi:hypothetical protein
MPWGWRCPPGGDGDATVDGAADWDQKTDPAIRGIEVAGPPGGLAVYRHNLTDP